MSISIRGEILRVEVPPLNGREKKWLASLESVLKAMPKRLLMIEIGGSLQVIDRAAAKAMDNYSDGNARKAGIVLADVDYSLDKVQGVSG